MGFTSIGSDDHNELNDLLVTMTIHQQHPKNNLTEAIKEQFYEKNTKQTGIYEEKYT